jgi:hypothetical protein
MKKPAKAAPASRRAVRHPEPDAPVPQVKIEIPTAPPTVKLDRHTARSIETLREVVSDLTASNPTDRSPLVSIADDRQEKEGIVFRTVTVVVAYMPNGETVDVTS